MQVWCHVLPLLSCHGTLIAYQISVQIDSLNTGSTWYNPVGGAAWTPSQECPFLDLRKFLVCFVQTVDKVLAAPYNFLTS